MKTIVYINNDVLQYMIKSGTKIETDSILLKTGTVINGVIVNEREIIKQLIPLRNKFKNVTVLIDSSNIITKRLEIPKLPRKKIYDVIVNELDMGIDKEYHYDYRILAQKATEYSILGSCVPLEFTEKYSEIFEKAKIKVQRVDTVINSIIKFINKQSNFAGKTFLMNIVNGDTLFSILFEKGEYRFIKRNRFIHSAGSPEYTRELYEKYNSMEQFGKSQKISGDISLVYYMGLSNDNFANIRNYIKNSNQAIHVRNYGEMNGTIENLYVNFGLETVKNDFNFKQAKSKLTIEPKRLAYVGTVSLAILLVLAPWAIYKSKNIILEKSIKENQAFISKIEATSILDEINQLEEENDLLKSEIEYSKKVIDAIDANGLWNSEMIKKPLKETELESAYYSLWEKTLNLVGKLESQEKLHAFVTEYRNQEHGDLQHYKGYNKLMINGKEQYRYGLSVLWNEPLIMDDAEMNSDVQMEEGVYE